MLLTLLFWIIRGPNVEKKMMMNSNGGGFWETAFWGVEIYGNRLWLLLLFLERCRRQKEENE